MRYQMRNAIVWALMLLGGRAKRHQVLALLGYRFDHPGWENLVSWKRKNLVMNGTMASNKWGVWELSEDFRSKLDNWQHQE